VRVLEPDGDFSRALTKLETKTNIHGALKKGFAAIYGFSSDEQGIRHPLLEKEAPAVDEADAQFMISACAAFVSYLINKARAAGLLK
jgi:thiaminase